MFSIHTPIQGVTSEVKKMGKENYIFNPHSHTGSDNEEQDRIDKQTIFNPHSHTGSDISRAPLPAAAVCFQSTLPYRE